MIYVKNASFYTQEVLNNCKRSDFRRAQNSQILKFFHFSSKKDGEKERKKGKTFLKCFPKSRIQIFSAEFVKKLRSDVLWLNAYK